MACIPVVELIFYERDVKEFDDQDSIHNTLDKDEDEEIDITETDKLAKNKRLQRPTQIFEKQQWKTKLKKTNTGTAVIQWALQDDTAVIEADQNSL